MPRHVQFYGSMYNGPLEANLMDDIDNPDYWYDLGEFWLRRADGSLEQVSPTTSYGTEEDLELLRNGFEYEFPAGAPRIRYFRFRTYEVYNPLTVAVMIGQITLHGSDR